MHSENQVDIESNDEIQRRQRWGLSLLLFFTLVYSGFIILCAFANEWFAGLRWLGVPMTVWYGFALIGLALIVAGIYGRISRTRSAGA